MSQTISGLISLLIGLSCLAVPLIVIALVIIFIFKKPRQQAVNQISNPTNPNSEFINQLIHYKSLGLKSIDDILNFLEPKQKTDASSNLQIDTEKIISKETILTQQINTSIDTNTQNTKVSFKLNNAHVILYLGSLLVTFSMLILVSFGWNSISDIFKISLLSLNLLGFLLGGYYLVNKEKFRSVGITFLTVGSFGYYLLTFGLWNLIFVKYDVFSFFPYWAVVSILSIGLNVLILQRLKEKRFYYLLLLSIYSLICSGAFTISDSTNFRVVILTILNFGLYLSSGYFKNFNKEVNTITKIVNFLGNLFIIVTVISLLPEITQFRDKVLAILSLFIPTAFIVSSYFKDKEKITIGFELFLFACKSILIIAILSNSSISEFYFLYFVIIASIFNLLSLYFKRSGDSISHYISMFISMLISVILCVVSVCIALTFTRFASEYFTDTYKSILVMLPITVLLSQFNLLVNPVEYKKNLFVGFTLVNVLLIIFVLLETYLVASGQFIKLNYTYIYLAVSLIFGGAELFLMFYKSKDFSYILKPLTISGIILTFILSIISFDWGIFTISTFTLFTYFLLRHLIAKSFISRVLSNVFVPLSIIAIVNYLNTTNYLSDKSIYAYFFLLASAITWVIFEFGMKDKGITEKINFLVLIFIGTIFSQIYSEAAKNFNLEFSSLIPFSALLLTVVSYRAYKFKTVRYAALFSLCLNSTLWLILVAIRPIIDYSFIVTIMLIVNTSILGFGYYKKSLGPSFQAFMNTTLIINSFFFVSALFLVGTSDLKFPFAAISYIVFFYSLLINKSTLIKKLSGIPLILLSWEIIPLLNFNSHLNVLVVSIYLFVLSLFSSYEKKDGQAKFFEISAFILEFSALCFSSLIWETEIGRIIFGIVLIALSIITIIYSLNSNKKYLLVISSIFLALELFIRLLFVIVVIPWWVYLLLVGLGLIAFAIYSIRKER